MSIPKLLYLASFILALLVNFLFFRYLYWGFWARLTVWKKRRALNSVEVGELHLDLPYFTVLIPAREEADVIAQTIDHLTSLNYPGNRYEIMVITDAKELQSGSGKITTQDVVEEKLKEFALRSDVPALKHVIVPCDFDGKLWGTCLGEEVPSTKARALNYGLTRISSSTVICSFYDAESRPEKDVLLYVAARYNATGGRQKLWQGPVFQVRNFYQLKPINKIIALYQSLAHEWYLPVLMRHLPFMGGTNMHVQRDVLEKIGGFDPEVLSEDLDLGVRSYLETGAWPEYLPVASSEQTPPTYRAYFRQRLRWGSGHLQVFDKLRNTAAYPDKKRLPLLIKLFWKGHAQWYIYQALVLIPLVFMALGFEYDMDPSVIPETAREILAGLAPVYYVFTFYLVFRYRNFINFGIAPDGVWRYLSVLQLATLPVAGILIALPFTTALILRAMHRQPRTWVKTPRTREAKTGGLGRHT